MSEPIRVLFLCVHNSARSQMAEGFLRQHGGDRFEVDSAGSEPGAAVRPLAVKVMAQHGVDISAQRPKHQDELAHQQWDYVITTCDESREACPVFPGGPEQIHWRFDDPSAAEGTEAEQERVYFRVAREIDVRVRLFVNAVARGPGSRSATSIQDAVRAIVNGVDEPAGRA
ncbi:MAG TPA: arsenate reductase ArsC [Chloroflexota bacterium]|jgi:arsenate reductase